MMLHEQQHTHNRSSVIAASFFLGRSTYITGHVFNCFAVCVINVAHLGKKQHIPPLSLHLQQHSFVLILF